MAALTGIKHDWWPSDSSKGMGLVMKNLQSCGQGCNHSSSTVSCCVIGVELETVRCA
jgi:hypothetical protein